MGSGCCRTSTATVGDVVESADAAGARPAGTPGAAAGVDGPDPAASLGPARVGSLSSAAPAALSLEEKDGTEVVSFTSSPPADSFDEQQGQRGGGEEVNFGSSGHLSQYENPQAGTPKAKVVVRPAMGATGAEKNKAPHTPIRMYSIKSEHALNELSHLDGRLSQIEVRVAELGETLRSGSLSGPEGFGKMKTELALLEAEAHRLESNGVDNVYTGELTSGKVPAKETKKSQLQRLETLFEQIEEIFSAIPKNEQ